MSNQDSSSRKLDHIQLAFESQIMHSDSRFYYEPLLSPHPSDNLPLVEIAGRVMKAPIWISSMTGGAEKAATINQLLAEVAAEYGLGMGLGSCRPVLEGTPFAADFKVRKYIKNQPLFANLGIAQIEELIALGKLDLLNKMVGDLEADGLIIHVNPLQEWCQPEGDRFRFSSLDTIKRVIEVLNSAIIVKEVGQGFGPVSLSALAALPLEALDYGAFGGTNFSKLENLRRDDLEQEWLAPLQFVGHTAEEMTGWVNATLKNNPQNFQCKHIIVSGGISNFLDGYYHLRKLAVSSVYAQASPFLKMALLGEDKLNNFVKHQVEGLKMAYAFLTVK